jgi:prepilin peptidase CpaA
MSATIVSIALGATLLFIVCDDLRNYRIRNEIIAFLAVLFVVDVIVRGAYYEGAWHAAFALVLFLIILGLYTYRLMGGGDAKLLAVAFLWLGLDNSTAFSLFLVCTTVLYVLGARWGALPSQKQARGTRIPFGPAIAVAWLLTMSLRSV